MKNKIKFTDFITGKYSFILLILIAIFVFLTLSQCNQKEENQNSGYLPLVGNVWSNAKVYMGEAKNYQFTILGVSSNNCSFGEGLLVEFPSGSKEWKSRSALVQNKSLFVKENDPALNDKQYELFICTE